MYGVEWVGRLGEKRWATEHPNLSWQARLGAQWMPYNSLAPTVHCNDIQLLASTVYGTALKSFEVAPCFGAYSF